jgi:hypothetical protein
MGESKIFKAMNGETLFIGAMLITSIIGLWILDFCEDRAHKAKIESLTRSNAELALDREEMRALLLDADFPRWEVVHE